MLKFIKDYTLPLAMFTGVLTYPWVSRLSVITPYLIFIMLMLTFCKLSPKEIRIRPAHLWLLLIQVAGGLAVYWLLSLYHPVVAQGAFICMIVPTATSSAVIVGILGGNVAFLTSYLFLCNIVVAFAAPALMTLINPSGEMGFTASFFYICRQVGPLFLLPLLTAWGMRYATPKVHKRLLGIHGLSLYLWAIALTIVTGSTVKFLVEQDDPDYVVETTLAITSLVICIAQFLLGRYIGKKNGDPVSAGQGLGQKNTVLAIWMAQAFLNPISSVAPAGYVLWQNIINSYQLWLNARKGRRLKHGE